MKRGFTLVELLVVIAIMGIIAAAVIPIFSGKSGTRGNTYESDSTELESGASFSKQEFSDHTYIVLQGHSGVGWGMAMTHDPDCSKCANAPSGDYNRSVSH
jgi:prepilin-type N-terminal cleavage/methylation domain-containing protein